jgi:hypothetical protein
MFWIFTDNKKNFVKVDSLYIGRTKSINKASYWIKKKQALTWQSYVKRKFPNMELKRCELKIIE